MCAFFSSLLRADFERCTAMFLLCLRQCAVRIISPGLVKRIALSLSMIAAPVGRSVTNEWDGYWDGGRRERVTKYVLGREIKPAVDSHMGIAGPKGFLTAGLRNAQTTLARLEETSGTRDVRWSNVWQRARLNVLRYEVDRARAEENLWVLWREYHAQNPFASVPSEEARRLILASTNALTSQDRELLKRVENEVTSRAHLLRLDLQKLAEDLERSEAKERRIEESGGQTRFSLPKPD
jgi:hypothetical protein